MKKLTNKQRTMVLLPILITALIVSAMFAVNIGYTPMSVMDIMRTIFGFGTEKEAFIIYELRIPRSVVAIVCGMCLAGAVLLCKG